MRGRKAHSSVSSVGLDDGGAVLLVTVNGRKAVVVFPVESVARTLMVCASLESEAVFSG